MELDELVRTAYSRHDTMPASWQERKERHFDDICRGRRRRRRQYRTALAVMLPPLLLAAAIVAAVASDFSDSPPSAASVLDAAAASVASQPPPAPAPGQYLYSASHGLYEVAVYDQGPGTAGGGGAATGPTANATYTQATQVWIGQTGAGRYVVTRGPLQFSSAADQAAWDASSIARQWTASHFQPVESGTDLGEVTTDVSSLPTDPGALGALIAAGDTGTVADGLPIGPHSTFLRAVRLLVGPNRGMTPALEAALYQVLAAQPGIAVATGTTGQSGATGTALSVVDGATSGAVYRLIVDPRTGAPLEVDAPPPGALGPGTSGQGLGSACGGAGCSPVGPSPGTARVVPLWAVPAVPTVVGSETSTVPVGS